MEKNPTFPENSEHIEHLFVKLIQKITQAAPNRSFHADLNSIKKKPTKLISRSFPPISPAYSLFLNECGVYYCEG